MVQGRSKKKTSRANMEIHEKFWNLILKIVWKHCYHKENRIHWFRSLSHRT